jgi:RNA polymerase sigma-70 factor (ECF subfamily)
MNSLGHLDSLSVQRTLNFVNTSSFYFVMHGEQRSPCGLDVGYRVDFGIASKERQIVTIPEVSNPTEDHGLVRAAREGDRAAFGLLYDRYARMVHGILLARVPPREVDDLVQEVFLAALRQLHALRDSARFGAWLATITRNRANDYYRKAVPEETRTEPVLENESSERGNDHAQEHEAAIILELIRGLPETYREPLILRLVEGMTGPEIAERTGLTHGSVRVNLCRGMQLLREKLGEGAEAERARPV